MPNVIDFITFFPFPEPQRGCCLLVFFGVIGNVQSVLLYIGTELINLAHRELINLAQVLGRFAPGMAAMGPNRN